MEINVIISYNPWCSNTASANRFLTLVEGIANLGNSVNIIIYGGYTNDSEIVTWKKNGVHESIKYEYVDPFVLNGYLKKRLYIYFGQYFRNMRIIKILISRFKCGKFLIWTDSSIFSFKFVSSIRLINPDIKFFIELSEFLDIHRYNKGNFLQKWQADYKMNLFEKKVFFYYHLLGLMTNTLVGYYSMFPQPRPFFVHLPMTVDLERFMQPRVALSEFKSPYIAFVGVMNDSKDGVSILIKSFILIKDRFPEHKVYLVGGWNYDTPIHQQIIKDNNLEHTVFWMKEYPREKIPNIICNADLLVLPRPDSKQAQGGFPTKLGEYLATGNPVCATKVGEIPDYLTDNESVFFAEPGSVESFAEAMDRAMSNPANAKRVGANGRKVAEREFNKDVQARKLYDFLLELQGEEARKK